MKLVHSALGTIRNDTRGAVTTEYVVLVSVVGLVFAIALAAVGPSLLDDYLATRTIVAAPFP